MTTPRSDRPSTPATRLAHELESEQRSTARTIRRLRRPHRLGALALSLAALGGGLLPQCAPPPPVSTAPVTAPTTLQSNTLTAVNGHRAAAGVAPVALDARLNKAAQAHAAEMAARQQMTHTGANGSNAGTRITAAGYTWTTWGENVAAGQRNSTEAVRAWMNSAPHRRHLLSTSFVHIGIGRAVGANGVIYWVLDLAAPG
jgi:uncharacterized protein YkwD